MLELRRMYSDTEPAYWALTAGASACAGYARGCINMMEKCREAIEILEMMPGLMTNSLCQGEAVIRIDQSR